MNPTMHPHDFGQAGVNPAEKRTRAVALLTAVTMVVESVAGWWTGSMALLADGIHMGSHALALGLATAAYYFVRRHAFDRSFSLGSGKINDLVAYSSALVLLLVTLLLVVESVHRLFMPEPLQAQQALIIALLGLLVNGVSFFMLAGRPHGHSHVHNHSLHPHADHEHSHPAHHDHNLQAAILHVLADALTSVAAIAGIAAAWLWGWWWLDPLIALLASVLILRWGVMLIRQSAAVLLDREVEPSRRAAARQRLQQAGAEVIDLHCWYVGQSAWTLVAALTHQGELTPEDFRQALMDLSDLHHPIIEVHYRPVAELLS